MKDFLKQKKEDLEQKIDDLDPEKVLNFHCAVAVGYLLLCGAYMLGRWHVAKYMTGLLYLGKAEGVVQFDSDQWNGFMLRTPEKLIKKQWKAIRKMS